MRSEKMNRRIIVLISGLLLAVLPLTYLRVLLGTFGLNNSDYRKATELRSTMVNSAGEVVFDGSCREHLLYGNLIGTNGCVENSMSVYYEEDLAYTGLNPLVGLESLDEDSVTKMQLTLLSAEAHQTIRDLFGAYRGVCFAYNYKTGQVYMALSLPCELPYEKKAEDLPDGALHNFCFIGQYIPGSIMKVVTAVCALEQDPALQDFTFKCTGSVELPDGNSVKCHSVHGKVDMRKALGASCNAYMAALIGKLDTDRIRQDLAGLGFSYDGEYSQERKKLEASGINSSELAGRAQADRMRYRLSRTVFHSNSQWESVWGLIGQGDSQVNPIHMAMIAGAIVNGGQAANPYLVEEIIKRGDKAAYHAKGGDMAWLIPEDTAEIMDDVWRDAVKRDYRSGGNAMTELITHAKTGTAEQGEGKNDRALLGVIAEKDTAFCIFVEALGSGSNLHVQIANTLAELLPAPKE